MWRCKAHADRDYGHQRAGSTANFMESLSMSDADDQEILWHTGLFARLDTSFPKRCANCGRVFKTAEQYFTETEDINGRDRGLKPCVADDTTTVVEAFRNCPCGSTLMETFDDHREETRKMLVTPEALAAAGAREHVATPPAKAIEDDLGMEFVGRFADEPDGWADAWFEGLRPTGESTFPKECANCGRVYESPEDFFDQTEPTLADRTGLRETADDDEEVMVEAVRNCSCGSTLMDNFSDRRDVSAVGQKRRDKFSMYLTFLIKAGMDPGKARGELLKVVRGGKSEILTKIRPPMPGSTS